VRHCPGHSPAGIGAAAARVGAPTHFLVVGHPVAILGTGVAHLRTDAARLVVLGRSPQHEVGAYGADLGAVGEYPNMIGTRVHPAFFEAMGDHREADLMTGRAFVNALSHVAADVSHEYTPFEEGTTMSRKGSHAPLR
jgi:hypothetical protein